MSTEKKYTYDQLNSTGIHDLRVIVRNRLGATPGTLNKEGLIRLILDIQDNKVVPTRNARGRKSLDSSAAVDDGNAVPSSDAESGGAIFSEGSLGASERVEELKLSFPVKNSLKMANVEYFIKVACERVNDGDVTGGTVLLSDAGFGLVRMGHSNRRAYILIDGDYVKKYGLRTGDYIKGKVKIGEEGTVRFNEIESVNGRSPDFNRRANFLSCDAVYPTKTVFPSGTSAALRTINAFCPIAKGQRSLIYVTDTFDVVPFICSLSSIAASNGVKTYLLAPESRPEDLNYYEKNFVGETFGNIFSDSPVITVRSYMLAKESAMRVAEYLNDVVLFVDSLGALAAIGERERKNFLSLAKNTDKRGSITVIAVVKPFEVELASDIEKLCNNKIVLTDSGYPDIALSYTRRTDLIIGSDKAEIVAACRRKTIADGNQSSVIANAESTETDEDFVNSLLCTRSQ